MKTYNIVTEGIFKQQATYCSALSVTDMATVANQYGPDTVLLLAGVGESILSHYFDPILGITEKTDYTLDSLPLPCTAIIEGVIYQLTEQASFEFNFPGTYKIRVDAGAAFLNKEFEIVWP